jgi:hypothetical protein
MELTIEKQFPKMRDLGSGATYFLSNKSWRTRSKISGKIFQERSVFSHTSPCGRYTQCRRNTTRIMTRITTKDEDVVDWFSVEMPSIVEPAVNSGRIVPSRSWRSRSKISGKIFQERRVVKRNGHYYFPARLNPQYLTIDDTNVVDWLTEENTFNPAAITVLMRQEIDTSTYHHEERRFGIGKGNVKDRRPMCMGIDMPCEAIGWKGREYYTDEGFFAWKKPKGLKVKDMARLDYNLYNRICKHRILERSVPM